jgi:hypothetical protein
MRNDAKREEDAPYWTGSEVDRPDLAISARESRCIARPTRMDLAGVAFLAG